MGGDPHRLVAHGARGEERGAAADRRRPAAIGPAALRDQRRVAGEDLDRVGVDAEDAADEPREHRDVPLPLRRGAADDGDAAVGATRTTALSWGTVAVAST